MKTIITMLLLCLSGSAHSLDKLEISVGEKASFVSPNEIAGKIIYECELPQKQLSDVIEQLRLSGYTIIPDIAAPPNNGLYLKLEIRNAHSAGNAFRGHQKAVATRATLFMNGEEIATKTFYRDSMGGAFAGFKGSCEVLNRCTEAIAQDIASWLGAQIPKASPAQATASK